MCVCYLNIVRSLFGPAMQIYAVYTVFRVPVYNVYIGIYIEILSSNRLILLLYFFPLFNKNKYKQTLVLFQDYILRQNRRMKKISCGNLRMIIID